MWQVIAHHHVPIDKFTTANSMIVNKKTGAMFRSKAYKEFQQKLYVDMMNHKGIDKETPKSDTSPLRLRAIAYMKATQKAENYKKKHGEYPPHVSRPDTANSLDKPLDVLMSIHNYDDSRIVEVHYKKQYAHDNYLYYELSEWVDKDE